MPQYQATYYLHRYTSKRILLGTTVLSVPNEDESAIRYLSRLPFSTLKTPSATPLRHIEYTVTQGEEIGSGSFGIVYLLPYQDLDPAAPPSLRPALAYKILHPTEEGDFTKEAQHWLEAYPDSLAIATKETPSTDTVFSRTGMIMPYFRGKKASDALLQYSLSILDEQHILLGIFRAFREYHEKGFVHTDGHLGNIITQKAENNEWDVKLIDFGMRQKKRDASSFLQNRGLVRRRYPFELAQDRIEVLPHHDLYIVAYECYYDYNIFSPTLLRIIRRELTDEHLISEHLAQDYAQYRSITNHVSNLPSEDRDKHAEAMRSHLVEHFPTCEAVIDWYQTKQFKKSRHYPVLRHYIDSHVAQLFPVTERTIVDLRTTLPTINDQITPESLRLILSIKEEYFLETLQQGIVKLLKKHNELIYASLLPLDNAKEQLYIFIQNHESATKFRKYATKPFIDHLVTSEFHDGWRLRAKTHSPLIFTELDNSFKQRFTAQTPLDPSKEFFTSSIPSVATTVNSLISTSLQECDAFYAFYQAYRGASVFKNYSVNQLIAIYRELTTIDLSQSCLTKRMITLVKKHLPPSAFERSNSDICTIKAITQEQLIALEKISQLTIHGFTLFTDIPSKQLKEAINTRDHYSNKAKICLIQRELFDLLEKTSHPLQKNMFRSVVGLAATSNHHWEFAGLRNLSIDELEQPIGDLLAHLPYSSRFFGSGAHHESIRSFSIFWNDFKTSVLPINYVSPALKLQLLDRELSTLKATVQRKHQQSLIPIPSRTLYYLSQFSIACENHTTRHLRPLGSVT